MSVELSQRETEGITILDLRGRLVLGQATSMLQDTLEQLLNDSVCCVILNLERVASIDSTGLGLLVSAQSSFAKTSGGIRLLNPQQRHLTLLVLTKLNTFFQVFDDERTAIDSFFPDRQPRKFDILEFVQQEQDSDPAFGSSDSKKDPQT